MNGILLSLGVLALGVVLHLWLGDGKPLMMSRGWRLSELPNHIKEEKRYR